jgi:hypothetical protein
MATKIPGQMDSFLAGADLRTHQWKGVALSGLNTVGLQGATGICLGVLQNKPNTGEAATVMQSGRTPAYANGSGTAIAVGDMVGPDATGVFVKKAAAAANIVGIAQEACTIAGGIISVTLSLDIH